MSTSRSVTVWCDGTAPVFDKTLDDVNRCKEWTAGGPESTVREARELARLEGWVYRNGMDFCPACKLQLDQEVRRG